jgi:hypothetical protein
LISASGVPLCQKCRTVRYFHVPTRKHGATSLLHYFPLPASSPNTE